MVQVPESFLSQATGSKNKFQSFLMIVATRVVSGNFRKYLVKISSDVIKMTHKNIT